MISKKHLASIAVVAGLVILLSLGLGFSPADARHPKHGKKKKAGGPPPWAPAHGYRAKYRYRYYPRQQVYYNTDEKRYFWIDAGVWKTGIRLPTGIKIGGSGVTLEMDTPNPYEQHRSVRQNYPGK